MWCCILLLLKYICCGRVMVYCCFSYYTSYEEYWCTSDELCCSLRGIERENREHRMMKATKKTTALLCALHAALVVVSNQLADSYLLWNDSNTTQNSNSLSQYGNNKISTPIFYDDETSSLISRRIQNVIISGIR